MKVIAPPMSTPVSNYPQHASILSSATVATTEPLPDANNRKRYFSGHRVQLVDGENRKTQEDSSEQYWESKQPRKKRRCWQFVNNKGEIGTQTSTERTTTLPLPVHEISTSRPSVIVYPQPINFDPGEDHTSFFTAKYPTEQRESLSVDREPDHKEIITKFTALHQHQITAYLSHPGVLTLLSSASTLLKTLDERFIEWLYFDYELLYSEN
ncbi:hypothetical protein [Endozoicomonas sp. SCSIO W0465]|uniref:hypothetical protein n=1 Tax=Endozoicomonas sp. SCSIO W0465 TaxID=2918516 RepID=UPI00207572A7|nr:hypothetical protein [Endozoicomonas sp. SCSIO W0465]USE34903.1 hypothetical protein MJO57_22670 [Endozoicomonas sp. SCSIO W0465]